MLETTENSCSFSRELVPYMYDEQNVADRDMFEMHLADCGTCTDEFAELSFARYSVFEWNKLEFSALETPTIVIPYETVAVGWFARIREAMSLNWLAPATVAAALLVAIGILFFGFSSQTQDQPLMAANFPQIGDSLPNPVPEMITAPLVKKDEVVSVVVKKTREIPTSKADVRRNFRTQATKYGTTARNIESSQKPIRATVIPEMSAEVEDDESLRLADLFDSLDSK